MCHESSFAGFWELEKHLSNHHSIRYQLDNSYMSSQYERSLTENREGSQNTGMICSICRKKFKSKYSLGQHAMTHVNRKLTEVQCKICNKWLKNRNILRAHEMIHDELPQKCPHCDKIKPSECALKSHILQCHSKHKHQCGVCSKSFVRTKKLKVSCVLKIKTPVLR